MEIYGAVVLGVVGISLVANGAAVNKNGKTEQVLELNLPKNSFKKKFSKLENDFDSGYSGNKEIAGKPLVLKNSTARKRISLRQAIANVNMLWPGGVIPYEIDVIFDEKARKLITEAMEEYHKYTCIQFLPRANEKDYIYITNGKGCYSMIGKQGGMQVLSLDPECLYQGIIVHELMHAIGFWHEQSRGDRDNFVTIMWENIQEDQMENYEKTMDGEMQLLGEPYDYNSLMHYGVNEFSKSADRPAMLPKNGKVFVGQRLGFSQIDIRKIKKLYACV